MSVLFKYKPTNSESTLPTTTLSGSHTLGYCPSVPLIPGSGTRQLRTVPMPQSLLKLFKLANSKPTYPASPTASCGGHNKGFCPQFLLLLGLLTQLGIPSWVPESRLWSPCLGMWIINYLLNGSCFMLCWPYYFSNFLLIHYVLEHRLFKQMF